MGCSVSRPAAVAPASKDDFGCDGDGSGRPSPPPGMRKRSGLAFRFSAESARDFVVQGGEEEEKKKKERGGEEEDMQEEKETEKEDGGRGATSSSSSQPLPPPPPLTGPLAYRLGKTLGSGGFSVVREAVRLRDGARFAAKVIPMPFEEEEEEGDEHSSPSFPPVSPPRPSAGQDNNKKKKKKGKGGGSSEKKENNNAQPPPPSTRAEVEREVSCLRALPPHPNVVALVDAFSDPSQQSYVVVTELLPGGELLDALLAQDGGAYPEATAAAASAQVAAALAHAHAHGVVHRDVKLDNVLLAAPGDLRSLKLADFGLSAALAPSVSAVAAPVAAGGGGGSGTTAEDEQQQQQNSQPQPLFGLATVCGTPAYVAPEVLAAGRGGPRYGAEADCWSLGVLIFTLLGGYQPFWAENEAELFGLIRRGEYDRFEDEVWTAVSEEAKDLVASLLVVDPKRRTSARGALEHPWLAAAVAAGALAPGALPPVAAAAEEEVVKAAEEEEKVQQQQQQQQGPVVSAFAAAAAAASATTTARSSSCCSSSASRSLSSALPSSSMQPRVSSSGEGNNALALRRAASLAQQARNARGAKNGGGGGGGPAVAATQLSSPLPPLPPRRSSVPLPQPPVSAFAKAAGQERERKQQVKVGASSADFDAPE